MKHWKVFIATSLVVGFAVFSACTPTAELRTVTFESALGDIQSASIDIEVPFQRVTVNALDPEMTEDLISGRAQVVGDLEFDVQSEDDRRIIALSEDTGNQSYAGDEEATWTVGLSPSVPLSLTYDMNVGVSTLDLTDLKIDDFSLTMVEGELNATFPPADEDGYPVNVEMSSGSAVLILPEGFNTQMAVNIIAGELQVILEERSSGQVDVEMDAGTVSFTVPEDAGLRVEVGDVTAGSFTVPETLELVSGEAEENGIWETPDYEDSEYQLVFVVTMSSGEFTIQH